MACHYCHCFAKYLKKSQETSFSYCSLSCASRSRQETTSSLIWFSDIFDVEGERKCICGRLLSENTPMFPISKDRSVPICNWYCRSHWLWDKKEHKDLISTTFEKRTSSKVLQQVSEKDSWDGLLIWSSSLNFLNGDGTLRSIPHSQISFYKSNANSNP